MGDAVEQIEDTAELAQVRRQARALQMKSLLVGIAMTLLVLALPPFTWII